MNNSIIYKLLLCIFFLAQQSCSINEISNSISGTFERELQFPADHVFHNNKNEWIYFSGLVNTTQGKQLGIMYTIFRIRDPLGRYIFPSKMAIVDLENSGFHKSETINPASYNSTQSGYLSIITGSSILDWNEENDIYISGKWSSNEQKPFLIEMNLNPTKDALPHGENGYIQMADGILSAYYSYSNIRPIDGEIIINDEKSNISGGRVWMDRQWGNWTSDGNKWDWFSLRLNSGESIMIFQFRDFNGDPSFGYWTYRDGRDSVIYGRDIQITSLRKYKSYPVDWEIELSSINAQFRVSPIFDEQAFENFWEGVCTVNGSIKNVEQSGFAFAELSGYYGLF